MNKKLVIKINHTDTGNEFVFDSARAAAQHLEETLDAALHFAGISPAVCGDQEIGISIVDMTETEYESIPEA